jgi:hypothetical protein
MKNLLVITLSLITCLSYGQKQAPLNLTNALVVGQMDASEDRYSIEVNLTELLNSNNVKAMPSLNMVKLGSDAQIFGSDSLSKVLASKGIDTYCLVTVRGYDKSFKISEKQDNLKDALERGNLFKIYQPDIVSVSFEFKFFRNGEFVYADIVKLGNIGERESVLKKFRKKLNKVIVKEWK